jgi:nitrogen regulatory protein P-II 1
MEAVMDSSFILIIANFRSDKLNDVEKGLEKLGVERINVSRVRGFGEYHNYFAPNWLEYETRVEIFTKRDEAELIAQAIMAAAHTGRPGDGVVAVFPIETLYLIRTRSEATSETFWPKPHGDLALEGPGAESRTP